MKATQMMENVFNSIAFSEERVFKSSSWKDFVQKWDQFWSAVTFSEFDSGFAISELNKSASNQKIPRCEMGDINCFLLRNA